MPKVLIGLVVAVLGLALPGCSSGGGELYVYSGRNENLVRPILEQFADETGIDIRVRYGDTAELAATLLEEGEGTRADVFFSQDAGALAALASRGMLGELPASVLEVVPEQFRDPDGRWVGVTGRARVIAYNTDEVAEDELPESVLELTDERWKGRVGLPPTNASFVAFVSAMIEEIGRDRTEAWLEGMQDNDVKTYDNNIVTLEAVANGEIDLGLVNHYYLYNEFEQRPGSPVANHYPGQEPGGEGTFVNIAGVGILERSVDDENARRFVEFLLGERAQEYFRDETSEYPMHTAVDPLDELPPLASLRTIDVPLTELGKDLEASLALLKEVGLT